jgi:hypothetical protein
LLEKQSRVGSIFTSRAIRSRAVGARPITSDPRKDPFIFPSAACGRNQIEGFGWPRAVSRQRSAISLAYQHSASAPAR